MTWTTMCGSRATLRYIESKDCLQEVFDIAFLHIYVWMEGPSFNFAPSFLQISLPAVGDVS